MYSMHCSKPPDKREKKFFTTLVGFTFLSLSVDIINSFWPNIPMVGIITLALGCTTPSMVWSQTSVNPF